VFVITCIVGGMTTHTTPHTRNITRVARVAFMRGVPLADQTWYHEAYALCRDMAATYDLPTYRVAAVVAALSPRLGWGPNIRLAERMLASGGTLANGALGNSLRAARDVYAMDGDPLERLTSRKVGNFYRAIISRGADGIVIDRHAYDVAVGHRHSDATRPSLTPLQYDRVAECYRRAARILSAEIGRPLSPSDVQAACWVEWRRRYWAEGAYDA
jgi:hypothetical protein